MVNRLAAHGNPDSPNANHAFLDALRYSMCEIRTAVGTTIVNPDLLKEAERL